MTTTMKAVSRFGLRLVLPVAAILLLMLWVTGTFHRGTVEGKTQALPAERTENLSTAMVAAQTWPVVFEATGTVRAEQLATVTSRVVASVLAVRVAAGRRVASGETVVLLDDRDMRRRVDQAREAVHVAEANLAQAQSDHHRDKALFDQKVIPAYEFEHTETSLKTADATLRRLQQAQQEAEVALSYSAIRSPFAGVVVDKLAEVGDLAAPGKPLFSIYQEGRLWLEAAVPEEMVSRIRLGSPVTVRVDACGRLLQGTVAEVVPSSDPSTRTVAVRARLKDSRNLIPGMFGRLLIPAEDEKVLAVPASAVIRAGQLTMVDVVQAGRVQRRSVQLGRAAEDWLEIYSGLEAGEVVVVRAAPSAPRGEGAR